jgi:hypothetical protein
LMLTYNPQSHKPPANSCPLHSGEPFCPGGHQEEQNLFPESFPSTQKKSP